MVADASIPSVLTAGPEIAGKVKRAIAAGVAVSVVGVLGSIAWLALAPLAGAVIAPGTVKVDLNRKPIQHVEGGTVRQVLVRDGQKVRAGEPLLVLGDVAVDANLEIVRTQLMSEMARHARLVAERSFAASMSLPQEVLAAQGNARLKDVVMKEREHFATRRDSVVGQLSLLKQQMVTIRSEIAALQAQIKADEGALRLQRAELVQNQSLAKEGFISQTRLLGLERSAAEYESKLGEHQSDLARAQQKLVDTELRSSTLRDSYTSAAAAELKQVVDRVNELQERLRTSTDAAGRQQIVAPVAGEVVDLRFTAAGAVVGPRETILELVPDDPRLVVEMRIRPEDISYVAKESAAEIRFTSYPYRTTPLIRGKVIYVSADRLNERNNTGFPYYLALVEADRDSLLAATEIQLIAGLPVEVYVRTKERTALAYLLDPFTVSLRRAMRER